VRLLLSVPTDVVLEEPVTKVIAESPTGSFCLLPRHVDLATVLVPGLLTFTRPDGEEVAVAVDHGALVKVGDEVRVACQRALVTGTAADAATAVREHFEARANATSAPAPRWRGWRATSSAGSASCGGVMAPDRERERSGAATAGPAAPTSARRASRPPGVPRNCCARSRARASAVSARAARAATAWGTGSACSGSSAGRWRCRPCSASRSACGSTGRIRRRTPGRSC
jgi:alternate F1F0 ATPase F1 subunit epsilon